MRIFAGGPKIIVTPLSVFQRRRNHVFRFGGPISWSDVLLPFSGKNVGRYTQFGGWLGSRVVSVLDSGAEEPRFKSQSRNSLRQTVHIHCASVKLVAAFLRVAGVTAGLAESNGSLPRGFMTHVTCRLTAKNRDQLPNPTLGNRVWATLTFFTQFGAVYYPHQTPTKTLRKKLGVCPNFWRSGPPSGCARRYYQLS